VVDVDLGRTILGAGLYADGYAGRARMAVKPMSTICLSFRIRL
jgi:hypothetical protein